jgi:hypothetical protein
MIVHKANYGKVSIAEIASVAIASGENGLTQWAYEVFRGR